MKPFPYPPQAVIFDMDGLLLDTIPCYIDALLQAGQEVGYPLAPAYVGSLVGLLGQPLRQRLIQDCGLAFPLDVFLHQAQEQLARRFASGVPLKAGATALIDYVASVGLPMAVATSMTTAEAEQHLAQAHLRRFFRAVVGRDQVEHTKPHPDVYRAASVAVACAVHTCLALEDSAPGVQSAWAAGCMVILVPDRRMPPADIQACCIGVAGDLHVVQAMVEDALTRPPA